MRKGIPTLYLRLRGLPFSADEKEVREFFPGLNILEIVFLNNPDGRPAGECYCRFQNEADIEAAWEKDKSMMGKRYIEIFTVGTTELETFMAKKQNYRSKLGMNVGCIRARGLPFNCKEKDIIDFFKDFVVEEVVFGKEPGERGRPTGEAYIRFGTKQEAQKALELDGQHIGNRYLELYRVDNEAYEIFKSRILEQNIPQYPAYNDYMEEYPFYPSYSDGPGYGAGYGGGGAGRVPLYQRGGSRSGGMSGSYRFSPYDYPPRGGANSGYGSGYGGAGGYGGGYGGGAEYGGGYGNGGGRDYGNGGGRGYGGGYGDGMGSSMGGYGSNRGGYEPPSISSTSFYGDEPAADEFPLGPTKLHMRGLPFHVTARQVEAFFAPIQCMEIKVGFYNDGRATGEGIVAFLTPQDANEALKKDHETMGKRYIELFSPREMSSSHKILHGDYYKTIGGKALTAQPIRSLAAASANYAWPAY